MPQQWLCQCRTLRYRRDHWVSRTTWNRHQEHQGHAGDPIQQGQILGVNNEMIAREDRARLEDNNQQNEDPIEHEPINGADNHREDEHNHDEGGHHTSADEESILEEHVGRSANSDNKVELEEDNEIQLTPPPVLVPRRPIVRLYNPRPRIAFEERIYVDRRVMNPGRPIGIGRESLDEEDINTNAGSQGDANIVGARQLNQSQQSSRQPSMVDIDDEEELAGEVSAGEVSDGEVSAIPTHVHSRLPSPLNSPQVPPPPTPSISASSDSSFSSPSDDDDESDSSEHESELESIHDDEEQENLWEAMEGLVAQFFEGHNLEILMNGPDPYIG